MGHHDWSDKSFDWDSLYKAEILGNKLMKYFGRVGVHSKEKFGSIRWSLYLFNGGFHSLTHPGYVYSQYPKWLWKFDVLCKPLKFLKWIIIPWQKLVVKATFSILTKKYPHIIDEIIMHAPRELLSKDLAKQSGRLWQTSCRKCNEWYSCDNDNCPKCGEEK